MANVNFVLDEAASLGANMGCIEDAIDKYRGYGIRLQLYYQSAAQLKKCFPNEQDQTVLANVTQIFFAVNDTASAEYVSNRLGEGTIVVESGGTGTSRQSSENQSMGHASYTTSTNRNRSEIARRLMKPEEILALNERIAITFVPGLPPILTRLERYYEERIGVTRSSGLKTLAVAVLMVILGMFCLVASMAIVENVKNGRPICGDEGFRCRSEVRTASARSTRANGTGERTV